MTTIGSGQRRNGAGPEIPRASGLSYALSWRTTVRNWWSSGTVTRARPHHVAPAVGADLESWFGRADREVHFL